MGKDRETQAGLFFGMIAVAMVVALSLMALTTLAVPPDTIFASY